MAAPAPVRVAALGHFRAWIGDEPVDLGGPRQRALPARLVLARGQVVSVDRLTDDLWHGEPPPAPGYCLKPPPEQVVVWDFQAKVTAARLVENGSANGAYLAVVGDHREHLALLLGDVFGQQRVQVGQLGRQ